MNSVSMFTLLLNISIIKQDFVHPVFFPQPLLAISPRSNDMSFFNNPRRTLASLLAFCALAFGGCGHYITTKEADKRVAEEKTATDQARQSAKIAETEASVCKGQLEEARNTAFKIAEKAGASIQIPVMPHADCTGATVLTLQVSFADALKMMRGSTALPARIQLVTDLPSFDCSSVIGRTSTGIAITPCTQTKAALERAGRRNEAPSTDLLVGVNNSNKPVGFVPFLANIGTVVLSRKTSEPNTNPPALSDVDRVLKTQGGCTALPRDIANRMPTSFPGTRYFLCAQPYTIPAAQK